MISSQRKGLKKKPDIRFQDDGKNPDDHNGDKEMTVADNLDRFIGADVLPDKYKEDQIRLSNSLISDHYLL